VINSIRHEREVRGLAPAISRSRISRAPSGRPGTSPSTGVWDLDAEGGLAIIMFTGLLTATGSFIVSVRKD